MNKTYTREQIAKQLIDTQSAEFYANCVEYFIHLDEDGEFRLTCCHAAADFSAEVEYTEYAGSEAWDLEDCLEEVCDRETLDDPTFAGIVDDLTEQVNAWLAEQ